MANWLKAEGLQIHWWIWACGAITLTTCTLGNLSGLGQFKMFYANALSGRDPTHAVAAHLGGRWATKNIGISTALITGVVLGKPWVLAPIFGLKFVNDGLDMFFVRPLHLDRSIGQAQTDWPILGLPSALAVIHLVQRRKDKP